MEIELKHFEELIKSLNTDKDWLDILSDLSVPILSLTALIITTIISFKQWYIMKYEYKLKLYPERFELYNHLNELSIELNKADKIVGNKYIAKFIEIERRMFTYSENIHSQYQEMKAWLESVDSTTDNFDKKQYATDFKYKLSNLLEQMKNYLQEFYIKIS